MTFTVIIPARMSSMRLPGKPLADIAGKPMVVRVAERALLSGAQHVVVATDHAEVMAVCQQHHIQASMTRTDHPSGTDRIAEVAAAMGLPDDAVIVNVQGDEPFVQKDPLEKLLATFIDSNVQVASLMQELKDPTLIEDPNYVKVAVDRNMNSLFFSRSVIPYARDKSIAIT
jgi:3-deoxy-manno-octulosonate cytidylyltransferase (CMP-KDO synthetase)